MRHGLAMHNSQCTIIRKLINSQLGWRVGVTTTTVLVLRFHIMCRCEIFYYQQANQLVISILWLTIFNDAHIFTENRPNIAEYSQSELCIAKLILAHAKLIGYICIRMCYKHPPYPKWPNAPELCNDTPVI